MSQACRNSKKSHLLSLLPEKGGEGVLCWICSCRVKCLEGDWKGLG